VDFINDTETASGPNPCGGAVRPRGRFRVYSKVIELFMETGALDLFKSSISAADTRISSLPGFILVFGGPLGDPKKSARQLFLNWIDINRRDLSPWMIKPEDYQDWDSLDGYANLIDFERDAVCLTRAVIIFSESPGSHAELGAFCMDPILLERLFVVIGEEHYNAGSFIAKGPIKKIEDLNEESICTVKDIKSEVIQPELDQVAESLDLKLKAAPKSVNFDPKRKRDQFLLVADLIELFGALTVNEIVGLCELLGFNTNIHEVKSLYGQLFRFNIITSVKKHTYRYYIPTEHRFRFLDYTSPIGTSRFDRLRFKTTISGPWLTKDKRRHEAYAEIHGSLA
jgi:hypothetical protein